MFWKLSSFTWSRTDFQLPSWIQEESAEAAEVNAMPSQGPNHPHGQPWLSAHMGKPHRKEASANTVKSELLKPPPRQETLQQELEREARVEARTNEQTAKLEDIVSNERRERVRMHFQLEKPLIKVPSGLSYLFVALPLVQAIFLLLSVRLLTNQ